jgi:hypothetical protein
VRYKRDIHDMAAASGHLTRLRPINFRYKDDPAGTVQYGLVAEEIEKVYPELVIHAADGEVQSVRYTMLTGMLLNELQKQNAELRRQTPGNQQRSDQIRRLSAQVTEERASRKRGHRCATHSPNAWPSCSKRWTRPTAASWRLISTGRR